MLLYQMINTRKLLGDMRMIKRIFTGDCCSSNYESLESKLREVRPRIVLADGFSRIQCESWGNNYYDSAVEIYNRMLEKLPSSKGLEPYSNSESELKQLRDSFTD